MRFAILSPIYPYRGGIAQFSGMLYTELVKEGHEVSGRPCDRNRERASIR